jgi:predicted  nucleic acid-binding Zn-ribbon protein
MSHPSLVIVRRPTLTPADLDADIAELVALQKQVEKVDRRASQIRWAIREAMTREKLASYQTPNGHRASLFSQTRLQMDRAKVKALLNPKQLAAVLKPVTATILRVK